MPDNTDNAAGRPKLTQVINQGDRVNALLCPKDLGQTWLENEYDEAAEETLLAYQRAGELAARPHLALAEGLKHAARKAIATSDELRGHASRALADHEEATKVLGSHRRRARDAKAVKWVRTGGLVIGDVAGVSGAALLLGEAPLNAFSQGISSGVAVVTLGAVGAHVRYMTEARTRAVEPSKLNDGMKKYGSFFAGPRAEHLVKAVTFGAVGGIAILAVAIFALRTTTEGILPGVAFAALSVALGVASFVNSYDTADEVAEFLDDTGKKAEKAGRVADQAAENPVIRAQAEAKAKADSVVREHDLAGEASARAIHREKYAAMARSSGVVGHGVKTPRTPRPSGPVAGAKRTGDGSGTRTAGRSGKRTRGDVPGPSRRGAKRRPNGSK